jgi:outer membrane protein OmpA-like peptidoglycan-associated protein
VRLFTSNGTIDARADNRNFGGGGSQQFDQKDQGTEFGFAFHFNPEWSAGILLGKSDADVDPAVGGHGRIKADTYGAYLTWMPGNGFYGDLSYRKMNFDTDSTVAGGNFSSNGNADGWSLEMGYGFDTASGWKIEPQVQFSDMSVNRLDVISSTWGNFALTDGDSARTRLGVSVRKTYTQSDDHSWTPYFAISAVHEDKGDNRFNIAGNFNGGSDLRGDSGLFEAGATGQMGAWTVFGGLTYRDGAAFNGVFGGQIGVRYAFGKKPAPAPAPVVAPPPPPQKTCADMDDDGDGVNNCNDKCPDSAAGQAIGPDGCPVPLTIDLKGVNFDFDKSTLRPDAVAILDEAVSILTKYPELKVEVAGHTDSIGTEQYNQGLSERRAKAVYDYLTGHGIDAGRLVGPNGYGESKPIDTNATKEGRARNRRTELDVQN